MELRLEGGAQLAVHGLVGLSEVLPAPAVAEDHAVAADLGRHGRRPLAGEGALFPRVAVLPEERHRRPWQRLLPGRERRIRRSHGHLRPGLHLLPQLPHHLHRLGAGLVHLPVATNESPPRHSSSTLRPGRSRPSRNSREAPPPVETWVTLSSRPISAIAAAESPPPTTVRAPRFVASARASATARVPGANSGISNIPMGPFQNTA